jgi:hypothetical protein
MPPKSLDGLIVKMKGDSAGWVTTECLIVKMELNRRRLPCLDRSLIRHEDRGFVFNPHPHKNGADAEADGSLCATLRKITVTINDSTS